jgi:hypothetical protein
MERGAGRTIRSARISSSLDAKNNAAIDVNL